MDRLRHASSREQRHVAFLAFDKPCCHFPSRQQTKVKHDTCQPKLRTLRQEVAWHPSS